MFLHTYNTSVNGSEGQPTGQNNLENREKPLAGKVTLITGSSRDIGAEIAIALAKEGVNIVGNHRDPQKAKREQEVTKKLSQTGVHSEFVMADITKTEGRQDLFETVKNSFGNKLDFLILNASGPTREINVTANNSLIDIFLPLMPKGATIVLMQSVPGHFEPEIMKTNADLMPEFYAPVAQAKYAGEQSLIRRMKEFEEKGILFIVICPPEVSDTSNMKVFARHDPQISEKNAEMSKILGLPATVSKERVGKKVAEVLKRENLPQGYIELFKE